MPLATRRAVCAGLLAATACPPVRAAEGVEARLRAIEAGTGGRLGLSVAGEGIAPLAWRADERFPLCSTFKVLAAAALLARVDAGAESLDRVLTVREADLLSYAPVSRKVVEAGGGQAPMTLGEACAAALEWSDNTAANLQLGVLGGPAELTRWVRGTGDAVTRLDRDEPTLNTAIPGDPRDTTSPAAMAATLERILLGPVLKPASRVRLEAWMVGARTGFKRLRAGVPPSWRVGDKTGSGDNGTFNVVAILRPPGRPPLFAASYLTGATAPPAACEAAHAEIGRLIARHVEG
ncbi:class A beta-lactamase [Methylobacterium sp. J-076]|uniref:class A beta-lactamase n=1 Tax=Methylobacterium sp. J-076 TaxID=2836655 RepID=UPI001FBAB496|nr:class A beta-lactamase [Methylobacterium sp. J-076]MCJ2012825.1 class A beta-lactamase [Methylobacterium sp. J-076]